MEPYNSKPVPIPRPRQRANSSANNNNTRSIDLWESPELDYENVQIVQSPKKPERVETQNDELPPVPAPRRTSQDNSRMTYYQNVSSPISGRNSSSANPVNLGRPIINLPSESIPTRFNFEADGSCFRQIRSDDVSSESDNSCKYKATSPKSLTESITDCISQKTMKVATKLDRSLKSFRTVSKSNSNLVVEKNSAPVIRRNKPERSYSTGDDSILKGRQMSPAESICDMMKIQFKSPLEEDSDYDIPKNKQENIQQTSLYEELDPISSSKPLETFTRSNGLNQSMYTRPTSKKDHGEECPGPLRGGNKSAEIPQAYTKKQHLYEELDVFPRQHSSGSSVENNNLLVVRANTPKMPDEIPTFPGKAAYKSMRSSMLDELRNNLNICSDSWNFYDVSSRDQTFREDAQEQEDEDQGYEQICDTSPVIYEAINEFGTPTKSNMNSELAMIEEMLSDEVYGRRLTVEPFNDSMEDCPPKPPARTASLFAVSSKLEVSVKLPSDSVSKLADEAVVKSSSPDILANLKHNSFPPSYDEATAGTNDLQESLPSTSKPSTKSKWLKVLKRRSSSTKVKEDVVLEMIPKPLLTGGDVGHQGLLIKFPSGMIGNVFNDLIPVVLKDKFLQVGQSKEMLDLKCMLSLQSIAESKMNGEGGLDIYCIEIVLEVSKNQQSNTIETLRQSHIFGVYKKSDRNLWMAKILQSATGVFPGNCLAEFTGGGWCYMKKSVSSDWSGAWILLAKRKLYFYNYQDRQLEQIDLRKARCIGKIQSDNSIKNLYVKPGSTLFIDCPPYATLYFVMSSPQETQLWREIIKEAAHKTEGSLHSQQLTKNDVPVVIDKCINFIYAHGSMSEGIYRKSGLSRQVAKILQLFKEDAFAVQLIRTELNEYDVADALKKFVRDMSNSILGNYVVNFVSITKMNSLKDKIDSYKELLASLSEVEYHTLKKIIGHLNFIASLEKHNKMGITNLAMIWASTLMANSNNNAENEQLLYAQDEINAVADLIKLYKNIFAVTTEEVRMELQMMQALQKYHAAAENMSDSTKHAGDFLVWVTIDCDGEEEENSERTQVNVTLTPTKTAADICKELAGKTSHQWYKLTLFEVIGNGAMVRPVHYGERALESVLRWTYWEEADRKNNYLVIRPNSLLSDVHNYIQKAPILIPITELKFADRKSKTLRNYKLQLIGNEIYVLKMVKKDRIALEESTKIDLRKVYAYIGREAKREQAGLRWAITLVEQDFRKRSRDSPYIGHLFGGVDFNEQILWYSSILHSLHRDDILPSSDLFF